MTAKFLDRSTGPILPVVYFACKPYGIEPISKRLQPEEPLPDFLYPYWDKLLLKSPLERVVLCLFSQRRWKQTQGEKRENSAEQIKSAAEAVSFF